MARAPRPVFLEKRSYRRRRLIDAVRLVVALGIVLWMMPLIWPTEDAAGLAPVPMSQALFYVFGVWAALIVLSALLAMRLREAGSDDAGQDAGAGAVAEPDKDRDA